jgi:hypothetical protein
MKEESAGEFIFTWVSIVKKAKEIEITLDYSYIKNDVINM